MSYATEKGVHVMVHHNWLNGRSTCLVAANMHADQFFACSMNADTIIFKTAGDLVTYVTYRLAL